MKNKLKNRKENRKENRKLLGFIGLLLLLLAVPAHTQTGDGAPPLLTVKEIMNAIITPATTTIWGAYQLETDAEWLEIQNAALRVIAAGDLLISGGASSGEAETANEADWQSYNNQMIAAAREVIAAVVQQDEEALSGVGNDSLYPPCESCHQQYQSQ